MMGQPTKEQPVTANRDVTDPAVQALIAAINAGDRAAFFAALTPGATMSDDGTDRDLASWADREIFSVNGHLDVVSAADGGRSLIAAYRNDTWVRCGRAGPSPLPTARSAASRPGRREAPDQPVTAANAARTAGG
jgi:hypothetical protein